MEGEHTYMKNKKLLAKLIFVAILILIIWYTFRDSAEDIVEQLGKTSLAVLVAIMAATVIYHLFEAWITYSLARRYNPQFKYREAVYCASTAPFTVCPHWEAVPAWLPSCTLAKKALAIRKPLDFI